ncbi:hypothetical protein [Marinobacter sp. ELB17]|uniref:hypothetical protein n=1 Tax=Marinobacter sp. ELB17 TaxID=270374 RepID=UPI0000F3B373|nr:hypothetical protein [Marinobacter sp. ELB17]EAZ98342.1 hypothetical protein MELB17_08953 [Marinobacter sp. ELB17]
MSKLDEITLYYPTELKRFSKVEAMAELMRIGEFQILLAFIDPRTNRQVEKRFTFYPAPQITITGKYFFAEYAGLPLKIPADLGWWVEAQRQKLLSVMKVEQKLLILKRGSYTETVFDLEVLPAIQGFWGHSVLM